MSEVQIQNMRNELLSLGLTEDKVDVFIAEVKAAGETAQG